MSQTSTAPKTISRRDQWWTVIVLFLVIFLTLFMINNPPRLQSEGTIPPCPTEDSTGCYWDAATMGDGNGTSFVVDTNGSVHYFQLPTR